MKESILILTRDQQLGEQIQKALKSFGCEIVDLVSNPGLVPHGELDARYNVIIVDKTFNGNARSTTRLVRFIRQEFDKPMIALEVGAGDGDGDWLQVGGCNYLIVHYDLERHLIPGSVRDIIGKITPTLSDLENFLEHQGEYDSLEELRIFSKT
jgi:stress-induced morphogen